MRNGTRFSTPCALSVHRKAPRGFEGWPSGLPLFDQDLQAEAAKATVDESSQVATALQGFSQWPLGLLLQCAPQQAGLVVQLLHYMKAVSHDLAMRKFGAYRATVRFPHVHGNGDDTTFSAKPEAEIDKTVTKGTQTLEHRFTEGDETLLILRLNAAAPSQGLP